MDVAPVAVEKLTIGGEGIGPLTVDTGAGVESKLGYPKAISSSLPGVFWVNMETSEYLNNRGVPFSSVYLGCEKEPLKYKGSVSPVTLFCGLPSIIEALLGVVGISILTTAKAYRYPSNLGAYMLSYSTKK